jgi:hypothetical protein
LYLVWGVWFPSRFAARGNWPYPDYWVVIGDPWYLGYRTPTVAPEPFVEQVAGANCWTYGRIGTHDTTRTTVGFGGVMLGLKASMISLRNPMVVPTVSSPRLHLG